MFFRRYGTFTGGIDLPSEKQATLNVPIGACPQQQRLAVPLAPCPGSGAVPIVEVGQAVSTGERIASAANRSGVDIFCPLSGRVAGLVTVKVASRDGFAASPAIELTDLSRPRIIASLHSTFDWRAASSDTLRLRVTEGGLTTPAVPPQPLARWVARAREKHCRILIANGMEDQPLVTARHRLLAEHGTEVVRGLSILARCIEAEEVYLAADQRRTQHYLELVGPARMYRIDRVALPHKYPIGAAPMLTKILTGREMPPGGSPMDVGVAVVDPAMCFATYRWVACGAPPTARVVTIAGPRAPRRGNFWIPFGADCLSLVDGAEPPVIHGGPMIGLRVPQDAVVGPATDAVLPLEAEAPAPPTPCIRCGWCTDHCPARLNVSALNDMYELGQVIRARRIGAMACVECGVCSYVCPARLPLTQRVKHLKQAIVERQVEMPLYQTDR